MALLFPRASSIDYESDVGSVWTGDTIHAEFAFPLYKEEKSYEEDVKQAVADVMPIFIPTGMTTQQLSDTLASVAEAIAQSETPPTFLSKRGWTLVSAIPPGEGRVRRLQDIALALHEAVAEPFRAGVVNRPKASLVHDKIIVRRSQVHEDVVPINLLYDSLGVVQTMEARLSKRLNPEEAAFVLELFRAVYTPTYVYSESLTEEGRESARSGVTRSQGIVAQNEIIVATGERISPSARLKLTSYRRSWQLREEDQSVWLQLVGNLGHVAIMIGLAVLYLFNFRRRIYLDNLQLGIILGTMLLIGVMSYITMQIRGDLPIEFLILIPFLSMLFAILFDSRTAFYLTVIGCFLVAGIRGNDYTVAIAGLAVGVLAAYTVRDIKSRTQLFRSIGFAMLGYALAIVALGLERGTPLREIIFNLLFAGINATISPVLTFAVILLVENVFGIATDLKLLEYDNLNHPLLRALADKAPGTYQHTLTMARLAESAAAAVGANALVAKVGALYHDIGKIAKAEYFVENQMQMANKHDRIKPEMSAKIIRNHVLDGIELAREYKLPQRISDFIPMHHGTTVIKYFLDKARETNPDVDERDYRYPGPLPHSRETAIVMLADSVEATARSLPNPTPKLIEETIDRVIKKRFADGQLDHCELTLADLNKIKIAFMRNLVGMSHPRIQYKPDDDTPGGSAKPVQPIAKKPEREAPMIPYIDDAFGHADVEIGPHRGQKKDEPQQKKDDPQSP